MEKVGDTLKQSGWLNRYSAKELSDAILSDKVISDFVLSHQLTPHQIKLSLPKFNQFLMERERFLTGSEAYIAKGYEPILVMNEGFADVSYQETKALKMARRQKEVNDRITILSLPKSYKSVRFEDIHLDDVKRVEVFESLVDFVTQYPSANQKGLYLFGDMGIGKSFLMAALAHELSERKGASVTLLHYPSFVIDIKNAINTGSVKQELDAVKTAEVLILDDIGAEQSSSWVRDEVLQVILQYRMLEELPTFFTSNYSFADLEHKLAITKSGDETWQTKRVMERIRFLAKEMHLQGINRR